MLETTKAIIKAAVASDPTITPEQLAAGIAAMSGKTATALTDTEPLDETLSRKQVAELLGVCEHTVSLYVRRGLITPYRLGMQGKRATGYSRRSIKEFQESARHKATAA